MKRISNHLALAIVLFVLLLTLGIAYAWYVNGKMKKSPIIQSEEIEGINLYLYRGNDYDFNGSLDSRNILEDYDITKPEVVEQLNKDLNKVFFSLDGINDKITGIMDNNIATYRLRIINDTDKEYYLNPYFIFKTEGSISAYNSILFRLRDLNIYNHTFLDKDSNFINYIGDTHFDSSTYNYYKIDISNGLYDTYLNPITLITNGYDYYNLSYDENNICTSITLNDDLTNIINTDDAKIILSEFYNSTVYSTNELGGKVMVDSFNETNLAYPLYDTYYSDNNYLARMEYNYINQGGRSIKLSDISGSINYDAKNYYPSKRVDINKNLCLLMYNAKIETNTIVIDSFSEYYIDYHIVVDSNLNSLNSAISSFATLHGLDPNQVLAKDQANCNDYELAYKGMAEKISEMIQYSEIRQPNFKIEHFCFDMVLFNGKSSYVKKRGRIGDNS